MNVRYIVLGLGTVALILYFVLSVGSNQPGTTKVIPQAPESASLESIYANLAGSLQKKEVSSAVSTPKPSYTTPGCSWKWMTIPPIGIWTEVCDFNGKRWEVVQGQAGQALDLMIGGIRERTALQVFSKHPSASIDGLL
ncbi:MAG: hypothetical protein RI911_650, partial [Candidatus Parcubacteria bacterium]